MGVGRPIGGQYVGFSLVDADSTGGRSSRKSCFSSRPVSSCRASGPSPDGDPAVPSLQVPGGSLAGEPSPSVLTRKVPEGVKHRKRQI